MRDQSNTVKRRRLRDEALRSLDAEAALIGREGPLGPYDTTYSVPHQHENRVVEFDLLTVTIADIIAQCGYPESARGRLAETLNEHLHSLKQDSVATTP